MDVEAYLARIGLSSSEAKTNDLATLRRLQNAHQAAVPFENVDVVLLGETPVLTVY